MTPVRLEPAALRSRVKHSTTEPLRSQGNHLIELTYWGEKRIGFLIHKQSELVLKTCLDIEGLAKDKYQALTHHISLKNSKSTKHMSTNKTEKQQKQIETFGKDRNNAIEKTTAICLEPKATKF